jgi:hypothetical protein
MFNSIFFSDFCLESQIHPNGHQRPDTVRPGTKWSNFAIAGTVTKSMLGPTRFAVRMASARSGMHGCRFVEHLSEYPLCGSRDAQTLALVEGGMVHSWGDGDFGELGRGGSEGCHTPALVDRLSGLGVCHVECGAQFSFALTCHGHVRLVDIKIWNGMI